MVDSSSNEISQQIENNEIYEESQEKDDFCKQEVKDDYDQLINPTEKLDPIDALFMPSIEQIPFLHFESQQYELLEELKVKKEDESPHY